MRVVFFSLEFDSATFSGNGTYAQSQVRGLRGCGHDVLVVCGRPEAAAGMTADLTTEDQDSVLRLGVEREKWGVLDRHSPWESFARRAAEASNGRATVVSVAGGEKGCDRVLKRCRLTSCSAPIAAWRSGCAIEHCHGCLVISGVKMRPK